jgi:hypothetical protein
MDYFIPWKKEPGDLLVPKAASLLTTCSVILRNCTGVPGPREICLLADPDPMMTHQLFTRIIMLHVDFTAVWSHHHHFTQIMFCCTWTLQKLNCIFQSFYSNNIAYMDITTVWPHSISLLLKLLCCAWTSQQLNRIFESFFLELFCMWTSQQSDYTAPPFYSNYNAVHGLHNTLTRSMNRKRSGQLSSWSICLKKKNSFFYAQGNV